MGLPGPGEGGSHDAPLSRSILHHVSFFRRIQEVHRAERTAAVRLCQPTVRPVVVLLYFCADPKHTGLHSVWRSIMRPSMLQKDILLTSVLTGVVFAASTGATSLEPGVLARSVHAHR